MKKSIKPKNNEVLVASILLYAINFSCLSFEQKFDMFADVCAYAKNYCNLGDINFTFENFTEEYDDLLGFSKDNDVEINANQLSDNPFEMFNVIFHELAHIHFVNFAPKKNIALQKFGLRFKEGRFGSYEKFMNTTLVKITKLMPYSFYNFAEPEQFAINVSYNIYKKFLVDVKNCHVVTAISENTKKELETLLINGLKSIEIDREKIDKAKAELNFKKEQINKKIDKYLKKNVKKYIKLTKNIIIDDINYINSDFSKKEFKIVSLSKYLYSALWVKPSLRYFEVLKESALKANDKNFFLALINLPNFITDKNDLLKILKLDKNFINCNNKYTYHNVLYKNILQLSTYNPIEIVDIFLEANEINSKSQLKDFYSNFGKFTTFDNKSLCNSIYNHYLKCEQNIDLPTSKSNSENNQTDTKFALKKNTKKKFSKNDNILNL